MTAENSKQEIAKKIQEIINKWQEEDQSEDSMSIDSTKISQNLS